MIGFIHDQRKAYGVEPICRVLPIAPSTYHEHAAQRRNPERLSVRAKRDEVLKVEVKRVFDANFGVYGYARCGGNWCARTWLSRAVLGSV